MSKELDDLLKVVNAGTSMYSAVATSRVANADLESKLDNAVFLKEVSNDLARETYELKVSDDLLAKEYERGLTDLKTLAGDLETLDIDFL